MIELMDTVTKEQLRKLGPTLQNLQGHISHGRRPIPYFFGLSKKANKEWIAKMADKYIPGSKSNSEEEVQIKFRRMYSAVLPCRLRAIVLLGFRKKICRETEHSDTG